MASWTKRHDSILDDPVLFGLSSDAYRLLDLMTAASGRLLTDGAFDELKLSMYASMLTKNRRNRAISELIDAALVTETDTGWRIVRYLDEQSSSDDVARKRKNQRVRQRRHVDKQRTHDALSNALDDALGTPSLTLLDIDVEKEQDEDVERPTYTPDQHRFVGIFKGLLEIDGPYNGTPPTASARAAIEPYARELLQYPEADHLEVLRRAARQNKAWHDSDAYATPKTVTQKWTAFAQDQPTQEDRDREWAAAMERKYHEAGAE